MFFVDLVARADVPELARGVIEDAVVGGGRRVAQRADSILALVVAGELEIERAVGVAEAPVGRPLRRVHALAVGIDLGDRAEQAEALERARQEGHLLAVLERVALVGAGARHVLRAAEGVTRRSRRDCSPRPRDSR